ncbi:MAG: substrate-binding domain-containing protein [Lachnospiraceae bacterium]
MKRKLVAMIMVAAMVGSLAACGNKTDEATSGNTDTAKTEEFNPDTEEDSMTIEEVREKNGAEVKVKDGTKIGAVEKSMSNEFWRTLEKGYQEAAASIKKSGISIKIEVDGTTDESDETGQQTMTENMTTQGCEALMLSPISDSNLTSAVENAKSAKIPVFNVNDGMIATCDYYVGPNAYQNGQLAAEWISNKLGDKGDVAIVVGMAKAFAARERTNGFKDWIKDNNSKLNVVAEQNADWDRQKSKELAATWIQQNANLKAIFCNNDDMALGVVEAVKEANSDILVVGVDGIGEAYDSIRAGGLDATVDSFPIYMAQVAAECTLRVLAGQDMPRVVATPQALIDAENVDTKAAEIIKWTDAVYVAK